MESKSILKKVVATVSAVVTLGTMTATTAFAASKPTPTDLKKQGVTTNYDEISHFGSFGFAYGAKRGDADGDGIITVRDVEDIEYAIRQISGNRSKYEKMLSWSDELKIADINQDGSIDNTDVKLLKSVIKNSCSRVKRLESYKKYATDGGNCISLDMYDSSKSSYIKKSYCFWYITSDDVQYINDLAICHSRNDRYDLNNDGIVDIEDVAMYVQRKNSFLNDLKSLTNYQNTAVNSMKGKK